MAVVNRSDAPVTQTFSALDSVRFAPVLKCSFSATFFKEGSIDKIFVNCDAMVLDESEITATCTVSVTCQTSAIVTPY